MKRKLARAAAAAELPGGAEAPTEILLLPAGEITTRPHDPRPPWRNPDAGAVVAATRELAGDIAIDYEHQSQRAAENGQPAPAAGWIRRVFERAGAVWGEVEWNERAAAMIKSREYRFISPVFQYDKATRLVHRVVGAALTNDPALYMQAIANVETQEGPEMDLEKLRAALGLAATATDEEIIANAASASAALAATAKALGLGDGAEPASVTAAATAHVAGKAAIARAAGVAEDAKADEIEAAVKTAKAAASAGGSADPASLVPRAEFDALQARLAEVETGTAKATAEARVDQAIKDGKVTPASRDWALAYATKDSEGFDKFLEGAPTILSDGRVAPPGDAGDAASALTADEKAVCRATGVSEENFLKSKKELAAAGEES